MSYYGLRKLKIQRDKETKLFVAFADVYDSSIRDWNGKRVWYTNKQVYTEGCKTREELEYRLFKDFLDGNFHGSCGKFAPLNWDSSSRLTLTEEEQALINKINQDKRDRRGELIRQGLYSTEDTILNKLEEEYYNVYYKAWKKYNTGENVHKYILTFNTNSIGKVYVCGLTKRNIKYTDVAVHAKVFVGTEEQIKNKLTGYKHLNIQLEVLS